MSRESNPQAFIEGAEAFALGPIAGGTKVVRHLVLVGAPGLSARVTLHGGHREHAQLFSGASELEGPGPHTLTARGRRIHVALAYEAPLEEESVDCGVVFDWEGEQEGVWLSGEIQVFTVARVVERDAELRGRGWRTDEAQSDGVREAYRRWQEDRAAHWGGGTQQPERDAAIHGPPRDEPDGPQLARRSPRPHAWAPHPRMAFGAWGDLALHDQAQPLDLPLWDAELGAARTRMLFLINHCAVPVELELTVHGRGAAAFDAITGVIELEPGALFPLTVTMRPTDLGAIEAEYVVRRPRTVKSTRMSGVGVEGGQGWRRVHLVDPRQRARGVARGTRWYGRSAPGRAGADEQAHADWELKAALEALAWHAGHLRMPHLEQWGAAPGALLGASLLEVSAGETGSPPDAGSPPSGEPGPASLDAFTRRMMGFSVLAAADMLGGPHLALARAAGLAPGGASSKADPSEARPPAAGPPTEREPGAGPAASASSGEDGHTAAGARGRDAELDGHAPNASAAGREDGHIAPTLTGDFQRIYHHIPFLRTNISLGKEYDRDQHDPLHAGYSATTDGHGLIRNREVGASMTFESERQTWIQSTTSSIWLGAGASGLNFISGGAQYLSSGRGVVLAAGWGEHGDMTEFGSDLAPPIPQVQSISEAMTDVTLAFTVANNLVAAAGLVYAGVRIAIAVDTWTTKNMAFNLTSTMWMWANTPIFLLNATKTALAVHGQINKFAGLGHDPVLPPQTVNMVALGGFLAGTPAFGSLYGLTGASFRSLNAAALGIVNVSLDSIVVTGMFGFLNAGITAGRSVTVEGFANTQIKASKSMLDLTGATVSMTALNGQLVHGTAGVSMGATSVSTMAGTALSARGVQAHASADINLTVCVGGTYGVHITPTFIMVGTMAKGVVDPRQPHLLITDSGVNLVGGPAASVVTTPGSVRSVGPAGFQVMTAATIVEQSVLTELN